jgi:glycosyltransferase involved in cell wall biosynthesis
VKILFLSRWFPWPTNNGSKLRIYNLLRVLHDYHDVTLLSFVDQTGGNPDAPELRALCSEVHTLPWHDFNPGSLHSRFGFFHRKPRSIIDTFSPEMACRISEILTQTPHDLVIASQLPMAAYCEYFAGLPAIFEEVELGLSNDPSGHAAGSTQHWRSRLTWLKLHSYLTPLLRTFRAVTVVSEQERALVLKNFPDVREVSVIPNGILLADYVTRRLETISPTLIFTGSFHYHANYEAMVWFVREVFPSILEQIPHTQLIITGDHLGLALPSNRNVQLVGRVDDVKCLISAATVAIAPLQAGGGTRLKILEAMALGTPVVATSKGAEGLGARDGEQLLVADDPVVFSNCVTRLLTNPSLRQTMSRIARQFVEQFYDWESNGFLFLQLVESVAAKQVVDARGGR